MKEETKCEKAVKEQLFSDDEDDTFDNAMEVLDTTSADSDDGNGRPTPMTGDGDMSDAHRQMHIDLLCKKIRGANRRDHLKVRKRFRKGIKNINEI